MIASPSLNVSFQPPGPVSFAPLTTPSGLSRCGAALEPSSSRTLSFHDRRRVPPSAPHLEALLRGSGLDGAIAEWLAAHPAAAAEELEVSLSLSLPREAFQSWLEAPGEGDPEFFACYAAVSRAVQAALRRWIPYVYFNDPTRYDDFLPAWPLLVYQSMPPFRGRPRAEFTYDVLEVGATLLMRRSILRNLAASLDRVRRHLTALGKAQAARFYDPEEAPAILTEMARHPRWLNGLLAADAFFVNCLVNLGLSGHAFRETAARHLARAVRQLTRFSDTFVTQFQRRLRRLYAGRDFSPLGTLLLIEATRALRAARGRQTPLEAVLLLSGRDAQQTFMSRG